MLPVQLLVFLASHGLTTARDEMCEKFGLVESGQSQFWFADLLLFVFLAPTKMSEVLGWPIDISDPSRS